MLLPFLALGPLDIVGVIEHGRLLADDGGSIASRAGTVSGIVAFSIWEVVVLVQRGTAGLWRDFIAPDLAEALDGGAETVRLLYRGVNAVQATMDVGFDIFYCLCIVLFSTLMLSDEIFGRWVGGGWDSSAVAGCSPSTCGPSPDLRRSPAWSTSALSPRPGGSWSWCSGPGTRRAWKTDADEPGASSSSSPDPTAQADLRP